MKITIGSTRQGSWGILTGDRVKRRDSFVIALIAALAPFYNPHPYQSRALII